jgi:predicted enzyme related to lactoylglutathione lyase
VDLKEQEMFITGLDLLFLEVNNLEESIAFYTKKLRFEAEKVAIDAEPPIATVKAGRLRITLVQQLETMLKRGRGVHFILGVDDVDAYYYDLCSRDVEVTKPADEGWGGRFISLVDPDKYRFFFVQWHYRDSALLNLSI